MSSDPAGARREARSRMLGKLGALEQEVVELDDRGRQALAGAYLHDGSLLEIGQARHLQWPWSLQGERERLASCETSVGLGYAPSADWTPIVFGCSSRLCPVCFAARAGKGTHTWAPILSAALADGAGAWHVTLTQRTAPAPGSAVLAREEHRWDGDRPSPGVATPAVAGEGAFPAYVRWLDTWRATHTSRAGRELWRGLGVLRGIEWTLRSGARSAPRRQRPRWHCHGHLIVISTDPRWDPRALLAHWHRRSTGRAGEPIAVRGPRRGPIWQLDGQHAERIWTDRALLEVLKYPFKTSDLTTGGALDAWAALRGTRTHQPSGSLHGQSSASKAQPWAEYIAAREERERWGILQFWDPDNGGWVRWAMGATTIRDSTSLPGSSRRRRWRIRDGAGWYETEETEQGWVALLRRVSCSISSGSHSRPASVSSAPSVCSSRSFELAPDAV